jgi:hypothetical protein
MIDRADGTTLTLRFADGRGKRFEIDPRDDGRFAVTERVLTRGGDWRPVGTEIATAVGIDN